MKDGNWLGSTLIIAGLAILVIAITYTDHYSPPYGIAWNLSNAYIRLGPSQESYVEREPYVQYGLTRYQNVTKYRTYYAFETKLGNAVAVAFVLSALGLIVLLSGAAARSNTRTVAIDALGASEEPPSRPTVPLSNEPSTEKGTIATGSTVSLQTSSKSRNHLSTSSFILGIIGAFAYQFYIIPLLAFVFGFWVVLSPRRQQFRNTWMAYTGTAMGALYSLLSFSVLFGSVS